MGIGNNIKRHRIKAGLSRDDLIVKCKGVFSSSHLLKVENEIVNNPGINLLVAIADELKISIDDLIGRKIPQSKK